MFFLVYVSAAVTWFSDTELRTLLVTARVNNAHAGITGMLLYKDGNFMQALEGDETAVRALFARIGADRRHRSVVLIDSGEAAARQFGSWSMAFHDLNADNGTMPPGYSAFLEVPLTEAEFAATRGRCWEMLHLFRQMD